MLDSNGRGGGIRTRDPLHPMPGRYIWKAAPTLRFGNPPSNIQHFIFAIVSLWRDVFDVLKLEGFRTFSTVSKRRFPTPPV